MPRRGFRLIQALRHCRRTENQRARGAASGTSEAALDQPDATVVGRPFAFMHVPKTAGSSIVSGLKQAFDGAMIVTPGFDRSLFGSFDAFDQMSEEAQRLLYLNPTAFPPAPSLVAGHFAYGTIRSAYPRARLMTVLREPVTRLLSLWVYWRQTPPASIEGWRGWSDRVRLADLPLAEFLGRAEIAAQTDNIVIRQLLWPNPLVPADRFIDPCNDLRLLRQAGTVLRTFDHVDLVERAGLADRLGRWIGRPCVIGRENVTATMPAHLGTSLEAELTDQAWTRLHACSRLDLRLWSALARRGSDAAQTYRLRERTLVEAVARYAALLQAAA